MGIFKAPKITTTERTSLVLEDGEIVYDTDLKSFFKGDGTTSGGVSIVGDMDSISDGSTYVKTENNFTDSEKTKLTGIESGANNYTHPTSHPPSIITQDSSNRFVTDAEKTTWNSKADGTHTHIISDVTGLQSALDGKQVAGSYANATHSHSISDVTGLQTALDGKAAASHTHAISDITNLQTELDGKANILSRDTALIIETDFYNITSPFSQALTGTAVSSGTITAIAAVPNHPGIVALRDSTTANGGYRVMTDVAAFRIAGGEKYVCSFQVRSARAGCTSYMGFFDSTSIAAPTDAACFVITANGSIITMIGRTRANNTATDTVVTFNPSINTWYTGIIEVNSNASSVNFLIFNESGTNVYSQNLANLPTAAGRETGAGVAAYESTNDAAADILHLDYLRIEINRTLTR